MTKDRSNTFASKKTNTPVVAAHLDQLERRQSIPNASLTYEMDGPEGTYIRASVQADKQGKITHGRRTLKNASIDVNEQIQKARLQGVTRAQFQSNASYETFKAREARAKKMNKARNSQHSRNR